MFWIGGIVGFLRYFASGKYLLQLIPSIFRQYFDKGTDAAFFCVSLRDDSKNGFVGGYILTAFFT